MTSWGAVWTTKTMRREAGNIYNLFEPMINGSNDDTVVVVSKKSNFAGHKSLLLLAINAHLSDAKTKLAA